MLVHTVGQAQRSSYRAKF